MNASSRTVHSFLIASVIALLGSALHAQQQPLITDPQALQAAADKAIPFVLSREALDPNALVPQTGQPLPSNGLWSVSRKRPTSCPALDSTPTQATCIRVLYTVPNTEVSCEWVVILQPDGIHGTILEQNLDSIRYLLRTARPDEARGLILTRALPLTPRHAPAGTVELHVYVGANGDPIRSIVISGPEPLRTVSYVASRQWLFKPLTVGNRAIPYQIILKFNFDSSGKVTSDP